MTSVPDIDIDFPRDIREGLILAIQHRYGDEHAALVAAFPTYRVRGAIRDLGKALALPQGEIERMARMTDGWDRGADSARLPGDSDSPRWRAFRFLMDEIMGLPRHISQHSGGMVIASAPLVELVPVLPAAMEGRRICQWDKDSCADAGFLKIDLLGLGMLSAVEECVDLIARTATEPVDLSRVGFDDPQVYAEIQAGDTVGVFQIESRAQMQSIVRTQPESLDDLTVQVAAGADRRQGRQPVHQAPQAAARGSRLPGAVRPPAAGGAAARHAGRDRLPGSGAGGGDRAGRLHHR
jgi:error-prone DNA polymerase